MFKFMHAADLHLDSPLRGLERYEGAPVDAIRGATRRALENLTALALEERVAFVLIAGDVYDGNWPDHNTGLFFNAQMSRLREANIPVFLISGNHDAENRMTRSLKLPDNVYRFDSGQAESRTLDDLGVTIHGQSFATAAVTERLAVGYPACRAGDFNIGLLHTSATGYEGHEPYAPCSPNELLAKDYDYWALGHIHKRMELLAEPRVAFSGNVQGRHIRETGPKGCSIVEVDDRRKTSIRFEPLDVLRWERLSIDAADAERPDDVVALFAQTLRTHLDQSGGRLLAVRVELTGPTAAHEALTAHQAQWSAELRNTANDQSGGQAWIEKIKFETRPPADTELIHDGPLGEMLQYLADVQTDDAELEALAASLKDLAAKLPAELKEDGDAGEQLDLLDNRWLRDTLAQVQPLLCDRLLKGAEA
ncbi:MAG: exonuclease SbcCD subunit D [Pirellulales bacterium]